MFFLYLFISWLIASFILSVNAGFNSNLYKNKFSSQLSVLEMKIRNNEASLKERLFIVFFNFIGCIFAPQAYVLALPIFIILKKLF